MIALLLQEVELAAQLIVLEAFLFELPSQSLLVLVAREQVGFELAGPAVDGPGFVLLVLDVSFELINCDVEGVYYALALEQLGFVRLKVGDLVLQPVASFLEAVELVRLGPDNIVEPFDFLCHNSEALLILLDLVVHVAILHHCGLEV